MRRTIERLSVPNGPLVKKGKTTNTEYSLSPLFIGQMDLLNEATKIGLTHILKSQNQLSNSDISSDGINDGIIGEK